MNYYPIRDPLNNSITQQVSICSKLALLTFSGKKKGWKPVLKVMLKFNKSWLYGSKREQSWVKHDLSHVTVGPKHTF